MRNATVDGLGVHHDRRRGGGPGGEPGHPHTGWVFPYHGPELETYKGKEVEDAGALLLGRVTYEGFAEA